jgi:hypothetical protein
MSADDVFWWANWILIGALLVGVAATYAIVVSGNLKEAALRREVAAAGAVAETAKANAAAAAERATVLETEAAQAKERGAALENEAAQARLEQEQLKAHLAWRAILPVEAAKLEKALSDHPGKINLQWTANDTEAQYLAIQIENIFAKAHWQTQILAISLTGAVAFGIRIPDSSSPDTEIVRDAFRSAAIPFTTTPPPPMQVGTMAFGGTMKDAPLVFVGTKPTLLLPRP